MAIVLNSFAFPTWDDPEYAGARITTVSKSDFISHVREFISTRGGFASASRPGYAPFCRHVFVPNFTDARVGCVEIGPDVAPLIRSGYEARRPAELAVLTRWVRAADLPGGVPVAKFLDLIFYSREQILLETADIPDPDLDPGPWDWGLISVKAQLVDYETSMLPITAMRNALGAAHGGSNEPIDPDKYKHSVEFWEKHVSVR
jgi:hypothetical protein